MMQLCLLALLRDVRVVERDARDQARDATAYVWVEPGRRGWRVRHVRCYSDGSAFGGMHYGGQDYRHARRLADDIAASVREAWSDAEAERYGGCTVGRAR